MDFGRELGEAVTEAGNCVWASVRKLLLECNFALAGRILNKWDELLSAHNSSKFCGNYLINMY